MSATVALDELRLLVIIDNELDGLSSVAEGVPQISELAQLSTNLLEIKGYLGSPAKNIFDWHFCSGSHGLSMVVTGRLGEKKHTILFDVGPYADIWLSNAQRLKVDLSEIEGIFLSHWHSDHSGALPEMVAAIVKARRARAITEPLPVHIHPNRPDQRGILLPSGAMMLLPPEPSFESIEKAGGQLVKQSEAHALLEGFFFASGEIERVTSYEQGLVGHYSFRDGKAQEDPLILDERYIAAHVRGRGVTVLSSCSHAGVINTALAAQKKFGNIPIDLLLGGYHLSGKAMEKRIEATIQDLVQRIKPRVVAPGHCSGWRAKTALAAAFAPDRYGPSVAGTAYVLKAQ